MYAGVPTIVPSRVSFSIDEPGGASCATPKSSSLTAPRGLAQRNTLAGFTSR